MMMLCAIFNNFLVLRGVARYVRDAVSVRPLSLALASRGARPTIYLKSYFQIAPSSKLATPPLTTLNMDLSSVRVVEFQSVELKATMT